MIIKILLLSVGVVGVYSQPCALRSDIYSPFYWRKTGNVCTEDLCRKCPWLPCGAPKEYILDQAEGHLPEDILAEIDYLGRYFNTFLRPNNMLPYACTDVCQTSAKQLQLQRIFSAINVKDYSTGKYKSENHMCIVIGPDIFYQQCGGKCQIPNGGGLDSFCVPDVHVSMDIWVYCPDIIRDKCHKLRFDVPVSCSCKNVICKKGLPPYADIMPQVPPKPVGWKPKDNRFPMPPLKKQHGPVDPKFNPNGNPNGGIPLPLDHMQPVELMDQLGNGQRNNKGGPNHGGNKPGHAPMHIV